ncbi:MAG: recombinase family protein [Tabrizicola sp.]|nr:recombinase family protein [Tabrizicola sp.]
MHVGYRRVSSDDQSLDRQLDGVVGIERVFEEKISGAVRERPALKAMIAFVRDGDTVLVHSLDRLGRDLRDLLNVVEELNRKGVVVEFVTERLRFGTGEDDPMARLQLNCLAAFAQWERAISKRRQIEGIAVAKAKNPEKYRGRPAKIDVGRVKSMHKDGVGATAIAKKMGIGRASVYRVLNEPGYPHR